MVGHLSRWLRLLGFDTEYAGSRLGDEAILERLGTDGPVLVTRDVALHERARQRALPSVLVARGALEEELAATLRGARAPLDAERWFTRCTHCNAELVDASAGDVSRSVPDRVREIHDAFTRCPRCGQVYWEGTHVEPIRRVLEAVGRRLGGADASEAS